MESRGELLKWFILSETMSAFCLFSGGGMCLLRGSIPNDTAHKIGVVMVIIASSLYGISLFYTILQMILNWKVFNKEWLVLTIITFIALLLFVFATILLFEVFDRKETPKIAIGMGHTFMWFSVFYGILKYMRGLERIRYEESKH